MTLKPRLFFLLILLAGTRVFAQVPVITHVDKYVNGNAKRVTISGSNFGSNPANLAIWFGAARATTIQTATEQTIEVLVPPGATYESITVTNKSTNKTAWSGGEFMMSYGGTAPIALTDLVAQPDLSAESGLFDVCLCDLDTDGKNDVATANQGGASPPANAVALFLNTTPVGGAFTFAPKLNFFPGIKSLHIKCGDLDGDGRKDLVITEADPGNRIFILKNVSSPGNLSFSNQSITLTGKSPKRVEIVDLDLDGRPELIVTDQNTSNNNFIIFPNASSGASISFGTPIFVSGPAGARSSDGLAVQDIDGDNKPEIIITQYLTANSNVYVYKNESSNGNFHFDKITTLALAGTPVNVRVGDIDGDSKPDIIATQLLASQVSVLLNASTSTQIAFGNPVSVSTDLVPWGLDLGDLDGDGKLDVVVASLTGTGTIDPKSLTILSNTSAVGSVSFTPKIIRTTTYANRHVVVGDIDGDSKPDITYTSVDDNSRSIPASKVSFYRNKSCITPKVTPEGPLVVCASFPIALEATVAPGATYVWKNAGVPTGGVASSYTPIVSGLYTVDITSDGCTKTSNTVNVTVSVTGSAPTPTFTNNSPLCVGGTLNIKATSTGDSFKWTGPAAFTETNATGEISRSPYQTTFAGRYEVEVMSGGCIAAKGSTLVETISLPSFGVSFTGSDIICGSDTKLLTAFPADPDFTYQWKDANGDIAAATANQLTVSASGSYSFKAKSISYPGCPEVTADAAVITKASTPVVAFTAPDETCKDTPATFTNHSVVDAAANPTYKWEFGDAGTATTEDAVHTYTALGSFTAKLTAAYRNNACATSFTKPITVSLPEVATITAPNNNFAFCEGTNLTLSVTPTFTEYLWSTDTNATGPTIDISGSGTYSVKVKNAIGCIITATKTINALPAPIITASATPDEINLGEQTTLAVAESYSNYSWTPVESLDNPAIQTPIAKPTLSTTYTVSVVGANDCVGKATVLVTVVSDNPTNLLKIANFFSPNGDEINMTWMVEPKELAKTCGVVIFDEKGSKVYEAKQYMNDWDGTSSNGKQLPDGVYYYTIRCEGDNATKTGSITILR